ncbi:MAG TPA: nucleotidyltransferase [Bacteriovoracaceae bacterium]|nr:nucleotidyltransferase [Bacteriovoracaceae bacterium]
MFDDRYKQLDEIFNLVLDELDVPSDMLGQAEKRYMELAEWLKADSGKRYRSDSLLYPQGSMLLGTAIRPVKAEDDYDFDFVYLRDIKKESISQEELKNQVGDQLKDYIADLEKKRAPEIPVLESRNRCWTLRYGTKFHMDVLPALPDEDLKNEAIIITDKSLHLWQKSNSKGYFIPIAI